MGVASGFTKSPFVYAGTRFIIGFSIARKPHTHPISFIENEQHLKFIFLSVTAYIVLNTIYVIEILPLNWRTLCGALGPWSIGVMLLAPLAYFIESWKTLSWLSALPMALSLISYP